MKTIKRWADLNELPLTGSIPECGALLFGAEVGASYDLAKKGIILTIDKGSRNKIALIRKTARMLDDTAA